MCHLIALHGDPGMSTQWLPGGLPVSFDVISPALFPESSFVRSALVNPNWRCAMEQEYEAL
jgi:hypothetical protein